MEGRGRAGWSVLRVLIPHSCGPRDDSCVPVACGTEGQRQGPPAYGALRRTATAQLREGHVSAC